MKKSDSMKLGFAKGFVEGLLIQESLTKKELRRFLKILLKELQEDDVDKNGDK